MTGAFIQASCLLVCILYPLTPRFIPRHSVPLTITVSGNFRRSRAPHSQIQRHSRWLRWRDRHLHLRLWLVLRVVRHSMGRPVRDLPKSHPCHFHEQHLRISVAAKLWYHERDTIYDARHAQVGSLLFVLCFYVWECW